MTFELIDYVSLTSLIVFVFWEIAPMSSKSIKWYEQEIQTRQYTIQFPVMTYPLMWGLVKACDVTMAYFVWKYTINFYYWSAAPIFALFITSNMLAKAWSLVFFFRRDPKTPADDPDTNASFMAAVIALFNVAAAMIITFFIGFSQSNLGTLYYIPLIFSCFRPAVTLFALWINWEWYTSEMETVNYYMYNNPTAVPPFRRNKFGIFSHRFYDRKQKVDHHDMRYVPDEEAGVGMYDMQPHHAHVKKPGYTHGHAHMDHHKDHTHASHHADEEMGPTAPPMSLKKVVHSHHHQGRRN